MYMLNRFLNKISMQRAAFFDLLIRFCFCLVRTCSTSHKSWFLSDHFHDCDNDDIAQTQTHNIRLRNPKLMLYICGTCH